MTRRFGVLWWLSGLFRLAGPTRLAEGAVEPIRSATAAGPVIYLLPRQSHLDLYALNAALASRGLPLAGWAPGVETGWIRPLGEALALARERWRSWWSGEAPAAPESMALASLAHTRAVCLFAESGRWSWQDGMSSASRIAEAVPGAVALPVAVIWDRSPDRSDPVTSFFLGKQGGVPGLARRWWNALGGAAPTVHAGRPVELAALAERVGTERLPGVLARVARRSVAQETRVLRGPVLLPAARMKAAVLDNPAMREFARQEAALQGTGPERIQRQMSREYDRIAARFSWTTIQALHLLLQPLWTRVFSGVDAEEQDIATIRSAMRDGTCVLVPCHKSHFDYVLLSWVLYHHDMVVPHVVAGMNLAIWPISLVLRGAGGFFVRRSFQGDRVFPAVFARYVRELVLREYPIEFFPEGGRTRSGKLLPPRLGVLGMVLDAAEVRAHDREVTLVPVALAYEQVAEEAAYARELGGEAKRPESLGDLVRARSVLGRRYGRVYLRVGEPVKVGPLVDPSPDQPGWSERPTEQRKRTLQVVGERILHRIGRRTVLLPTSLAALGLLALPRRGVRHEELADRVRRLHAFLHQAGAPMARSFESFDQAMAQALDRFVQDGRIRPLGGPSSPAQRVWEVVPEHRITLDFYKNQVLHWFAPAGLAACAIRTLPEGPFRAEEAAEPFERLRRLWRREFPWDPDLAPSALLEGGLQDLARHGALRAGGGAWEVADPIRIGEIYGLFRALLEGYLAVLTADAPGTDPRALAARLQAGGAARSRPGLITRPESLSLVTLQNAAEVFGEEGAWTDPQARAAPLDLLDRMTR